MGYNLKNARNGNDIENTKMAKFEVPSIKNEILWWFEFQRAC